MILAYPMVSIDASFFYRIIRHRNRFLYDIKGYSLLSFSTFRQLVFIIHLSSLNTLFFYIDLSKLRFLFLSRTAWHTHTRARTYWTEKEKFFVWSEQFRTENAHTGQKEERKTKQCIDFSKKTKTKKKQFCSIQRWEVEKKEDNSVRKVCLFICRHHRPSCASMHTYWDSSLDWQNKTTKQTASLVAQRTG